MPLFTGAFLFAVHFNNLLWSKQAIVAFQKRKQLFLAQLSKEVIQIF